MSFLSAWRSRAFSLLEVMLAVSIAIALGSLQLGQLRRDTESSQAKAVGEQLKTVGGALNSYVTLHYNNIVAMSSVASPGSADDPGPRTCDSATMTCTVTSDTLRRNGLLPNSFSGRNAYGATYQYYIRVSGSAPNWQVDGLVITSDPYQVGGQNRFDLIGQAMLVAGADSGTTRTLGTRVDGFNGSWSDANFPINQLGLLGYRVGYGTSGFSSYLRLDGTNPMTGTLRMDGNDIEDANNITATGKVTAGQFSTSAATSDALVLNEPDTTNRTIIGNSGNRLLVRNEGGVQFVNGSSVGTALTAGDASLTSVTASGTGSFGGAVSAASLQTTSGNISSAGNIAANSNITAGGSISTVNGDISTTNGNITAGGTVSSTSLVIGGSASLTANNWTMTNGGGWYMSDNTWIRAVGNKSIITSGQVRGGTVYSTGLLTANGLVQINSVQGAGAACATTGQFARDASGHLLQCVSSVWTLTSGLSNVTTINSGTCASGSYCYASCPAGTKLSGGGYQLVFRSTTTDSAAPQESYADAAGNRWVVRPTVGDSSTFQANAVCVN